MLCMSFDRALYADANDMVYIAFGVVWNAKRVYKIFQSVVKCRFKSSYRLVSAVWYER